METRHYKHPFHRVLWPSFAAFGAVLALCAPGAGSPEETALLVVGGVIFVLLGVLMTRTGLTATRAGLTVRGAFSSKEIPWERVSGFELDNALVVRLTDGAAVRYRAIHASDAYPPTRDGYAHRAVDELKAELGRRTRSLRKH
ncbi:PH domain-containing protein [Kitasatospora cineracea]|uniref:PH domain-containing protein n=1 Tax=Kitasatospora cineracea TaxID=88074 RepID=UPI00340AEF7D